MKIGEVSKRYNISEDTLRYYERVGVLPPVARDAGGRRNYSAQDLYWVEVVQCLRSVGMPLETAAAYVRRERNGCFTPQDKLELFEEQRRVVLAQRAQLDALLELLGKRSVLCTSRCSRKAENKRDGDRRRCSPFLFAFSSIALRVCLCYNNIK